MPEDTLRASLAAVEGDPPSPAFLASLAARIEAEAVDAAPLDLPQYLADPVGELSPDLWPTADRPSAAPRRWAIGAAAAAAAAVLVIAGLVAGLVVADTGGNRPDRTTSAPPWSFTASVLPAAVIHAGDGDVLIADAPTPELDLVLAPWYHDERSALEDLGLIEGLAVPFDLDLPGLDDDCPDLLRELSPTAGGALPPCGGVSAAQVYGDATGAARALAILVAHLESHAGAIYQVGLPRERTLELEAELGDEAQAFVLEVFPEARDGAQVVVAIWRTDNLVHLLWDIQHRGTPGGVEAVMAVAHAIDNRTEAERPFPADRD